MEKKRGFYLPETFKRNICDLHAEKGERWLSGLPELTAKIAEEWRLFVGEPFPNLSYHYVAPCVCDDGSEAVLKIGFAEKDSIVLSEAKFLNLLNGNGAVKLFRFDEIRCALLLERLMPGKNLVELAKTDDEQATAHAIRVMKKIRCQPPEKIQFPTLENWVASFCRAEKTTFDFTRVKKAQRIFERLIGSSEQQLIHGDLHHQNILSAGREAFMAIDPKGIVGDIGYDLSVFMINHANWLKPAPDLQGKLSGAIRQFSEAFEIEPQNIRKWIFAHSVLSAWWTFEENCENWERELAFAEIWEV